MTPLGWGAIAYQILFQFVPVWIALAVLYALSIRFKRRLGLYGKLFDSPIGMIGFGLVAFWFFTAIFSEGISIAGIAVVPAIATFDPLAQIVELKNKVPGTFLPDSTELAYLLGGDNLGRDVFSRMVIGAKHVMSIAPAATAIAFMVGITLGLSCRLFRRTVRHGPVIPRKSGSGIPRHPAPSTCWSLPRSGRRARRFHSGSTTPGRLPFRIFLPPYCLRFRSCFS